MGPRSEERGNINGAIESVRAAKASMGPRSEERGNSDYRGANLQAGAASMGPRSEERGNGTDLNLVSRKFDLASMGPRSEERGNVDHRDDMPVGMYRFNGAALGRTRKRPSARSTHSMY